MLIPAALIISPPSTGKTCSPVFYTIYFYLYRPATLWYKIRKRQG